MSLIHKALKKAEGQTSGSSEKPDLPAEAELLKNKKQFMSFTFTPRTVFLLVMVLFAAAFAVYTNFLKSPVKKPVVKPVPTADVRTDGAIQPESSGLPSGDGVAAVVGVTDTSRTIVTPELPIEVKPLLEEGKRFFMEGNFESALVKFNEALSKTGDSSEILNSIGLVYKKLGDRDKARSFYEKAIQTSPKCAECLNNLGVLNVDSNDNVNAVLYFKKAIELSETYADPYFNLATVMEKEGNYKSAVEYYKKFLTYTDMDNVGLKEKVRARIEDLVLNWEE